MSIRQFIYDRLITIPDLTGVYQGESLLQAPRRSEFPLAVYRVGNESPENIGYDITPHRKYFQVYIHDVPADYSRVDELADQVKAAFKLTGSVGNILEVVYLETSRDLDDSFLTSVMRYVRFQAILSS